MDRMMIKIVVGILCLMVLSQSRAQDPQFSQFYAAPIYLNPALTAQHGKSSFGTNMRQQWPSLNNTLLSFSVYVDHFAPEINSGFGLIVNHHREDLLGLQSLQMGGAYAYNLKLTDVYNFRAGIQGSYVQKNHMFDNLVFGDQLDIATGTTNPTTQEGLLYRDQVGFVSWGVGGMLYRKNVKKRGKFSNQGDWWMGAALHHLNEPDQSISGIEDKIAPQLSIQTGYVISSRRGSSDSRTTTSDFLEVSWTFIANWKSQGDFTQLDLGLQYYAEPLVLGVNYRGIPTKKLNSFTNHESIVMIIGVDVSLDFTVGFSHDFPVSRLSGFTGGSNEISIRWSFNAFLSRKALKRKDAMKPGRVCTKF